MAEVAPRLQDLVTGVAARARHTASGAWDDATLAGRVRVHASRAPGSIAVVQGEDNTSHTYEELDADAAALAASLGSLGVATGDVVSVQLPNRYEAVVAAVAIQRLGAVINPLLPGYRERELRHVFEVARPKVLFTPDLYRGFDHRDLVSRLRSATAGDLPVHVTVGEHRGPGACFADLISRDDPNVPEPHPADPAAVSELIFTSGTEATPKGIMHTEQTTNFSVRQAGCDLDVGAGDVVWMPSPVGHSTGFNYGIRFAAFHGLPLVLQDAWDPEVAVRVVREWGCTYTLAATTFLQDLVAVAHRGRGRLESLQRFGCGGAPVPAELVRAAGDVGIQVLRLYGSTEALVVTWARAGGTRREREETDGRAVTGVEIEIRGEDGRPCAPNLAGEIFVRGPNTCVGFYADPDRTAATFDDDGWVRSGDLGVMDEDGLLSIVGRKKEIIIRGGMNIAPREVEELLVSFDEIAQAAVIGLPDARLGERSCACVVLAEGATLTLDAVVARLREAGVASYKLPERLVTLAELPMTASGKVQKHVLTESLVSNP